MAVTRIDQFMVSDVDVIIDTFRRSLKNPKNFEDDGRSCTRKGIQTLDIFRLDDFKPILNLLQDITKNISDKIDDSLECVCAHMIEYEGGGWQAIHHHGGEDVSFILYLTDNDDGQTYFKIDTGDGLDYELHTFPKKGKLVFFDSVYYHGAKSTTTNKMVLVGGLKFV